MPSSTPNRRPLTFAGLDWRRVGSSCRHRSICTITRKGRSGRRQRGLELLEAWFVVAFGSWAPTTIRQTRSAVDRYLHPQLDSIRVGELTPSVIDAAYVRLRVSGGGRGQGLSSGTLARVNVVLRSALAQAQRWGWIFDNPVERAHRMKVRKIERKPPTPDEIATLIRWLAEHDDLLHLLVAVAVPPVWGKHGRSWGESHVR